MKTKLESRSNTKNGTKLGSKSSTKASTKLVSKVSTKLAIETSDKMDSFYKANQPFDTAATSSFFEPLYKHLGEEVIIISNT